MFHTDWVRYGDVLASEAGIAGETIAGMPVPVEGRPRDAEVGAGVGMSSEAASSTREALVKAAVVWRAVADESTATKTFRRSTMSSTELDSSNATPTWFGSTMRRLIARRFASSCTKRAATPSRRIVRLSKYVWLTTEWPSFSTA